MIPAERRRRNQAIFLESQKNLSARFLTVRGKRANQQKWILLIMISIITKTFSVLVEKIISQKTFNVITNRHQNYNPKHNNKIPFSKRLVKLSRNKMQFIRIKT